MGLLFKDSDDPQHPVYVPNLDSKKLLALTFLAYAFIDDRDGTDCLDDAIKDYCEKVKRKAHINRGRKVRKPGNNVKYGLNDWPITKKY